MDQQKLLGVLANLEKDIAIFKNNVQSNFLTTTITGEPTLVHYLQKAVIDVMMAAMKK